MSLTTRVTVSGRKSDPVWEYFERIPSKSGKGWRAICKQCKLELQGIVVRLKFHREKCQQLQTEVSEEDVDASRESTYCRSEYCNGLCQ